MKQDLAPGGPGGEATGFQHHDAPTLEPGLVEQPQRDQGRLAGPWWGDEHRRMTSG